jgi:carbon starvation protein
MENGQAVSGPGIAASSLLYLALPVAMGLLMRFTKLSLAWATIIFLPLVGVSIWAGQHIPLDIQSIFGIEKSQAVKVWDVIILIYCLLAAVAPMWVLLQPRGHLGGYFLYAALVAAAIGVLFAAKPIQYPAFLGFESAKGEPLFPMLFITIACGACSGFHSLIASGTTSKQLKRETDAKVIGYGSMLLEAMVAVISLSCVMMLAQDSKLLANPQPNVIYASGIGGFLESFKIPATYAISFALMAFTTFVYDTLDVCTRLGRYIVQELIGWRDRKGAWLGTALTAGVPGFFVMQTTLGPDGQPMPAWRVFWALFGASNQLLAALTLLGLTVWLWRSERARWVWPVFGLPTLVMYVMSLWALVRIILSNLQKGMGLTPVLIVAAILTALALLMLLEAVKAFAGGRPDSSRPLEAIAPAG